MKPDMTRAERSSHGSLSIAACDLVRSSDTDRSQIRFPEKLSPPQKRRQRLKNQAVRTAASASRGLLQSVPFLSSGIAHFAETGVLPLAPGHEPSEFQLTANQQLKHLEALVMQIHTMISILLPPSPTWSHNERRNDVSDMQTACAKTPQLRAVCNRV